MHNQWEEMLPFYVAGSLPKPEAKRLEYHLEHCAECSRSLNDWRLVADAVRAEAASLLRDLPPLSPEVLRAAAEQMQNQRFSNNTVSYAPLPPRQIQPARRFNGTAVMMAAAAFTVLLIGGILALMIRGTQDPQGSGGVVLAPTSTMTQTPAPETAASETPLPVIVVIEPSNTPTPPMQDVPSQVPPPTVLTRVPPIVPTRANPTSLPPPTQVEQTFGDVTITAPEATFSSEQAFMQIAVGGGCTLQAAIPSGSVINLYARPRTDSTVLTTISSAEELIGLATSDNSWYQLQSERGNVGWVQQGLVSPSGNCDGLPLIFAESATEVAATPTETVLPFSPTDTPSPEGPTQNNSTEGETTAATDSAPPIEGSG